MFLRNFELHMFNVFTVIVLLCLLRQNDKKFFICMKNKCHSSKYPTAWQVKFRDEWTLQEWL